jgi:hypothetical protein
MRPIPPSASTAKTLILIALIFQILGSLFIVGISLLFLGVLSSVGLFRIGFLFVIIAVAAIVVAFLAYEYSYKATSEGRYQDARTPTLILGIVGLFVGGLIVGILYLVAWDKLGDALREMQFGTMPMMGFAPVGVPLPTPGFSGAHAGAPGPGIPPAPSTAPAPACPRCHHPGSYVAQYNRYFCYNCQQYI